MLDILYDQPGLVSYNCFFSLVSWDHFLDSLETAKASGSALMEKEKKRSSPVKDSFTNEMAFWINSCLKMFSFLK